MSTFFLLLFSFLVQESFVVSELGRFGGTGSNAGQFKNPSAIDVNDKGQIFVCDRGNNRIQVFNSKGMFIRDLGGFGWQEERFDQPADIWARSTLNVFIADFNNQRIQRFDKDLNYLNSKYSNDGAKEAFQFREILSVVYSPQGDIFVLDGGEFKIIKFNPQDQAEVAFGYYESGEGELTQPTQIDLTRNNQILACDTGLPGVLIYDYFGNFLKKITHTELKFPVGIAVDDKNRIYLCDTQKQAIFIFSADGILLSKISNIGGIPLRKPADISVKKADGIYHLYILDGDHLLSAELRIEG